MTTIKSDPIPAQEVKATKSSLTGPRSFRYARGRIVGTNIDRRVMNNLNMTSNTQGTAGRMPVESGMDATTSQSGFDPRDVARLRRRPLVPPISGPLCDGFSPRFPAIGTDAVSRGRAITPQCRTLLRSRRDAHVSPPALPFKPAPQHSRLAAPSRGGRFYTIYL